MKNYYKTATVSPPTNADQFWPKPRGAQEHESNPPFCIRCDDLGELMDMQTLKYKPCPDCWERRRG